MKIKGLMISFVNDQSTFCVITEDDQIILQNDLQCHPSFINAVNSSINLLKTGIENPEKFIFEKKE